MTTGGKRSVVAPDGHWAWPGATAEAVDKAVLLAQADETRDRSADRVRAGCLHGQGARGGPHEHRAERPVPHRPAPSRGCVPTVWFEPAATLAVTGREQRAARLQAESAIILGLRWLRDPAGPGVAVGWRLRRTLLGVALHDPSGNVFSRGLLDPPDWWVSAVASAPAVLVLYGSPVATLPPSGRGLHLVAPAPLAPPPPDGVAAGFVPFTAVPGGIVSRRRPASDPTSAEDVGPDAPPARLRLAFAQFVGAALASIPFERDWTISRLAAYTGVSAPTLHSWRSGTWQHCPTPAELRPFCVSLRIPLREALRVLELDDR